MCDLEVTLPFLASLSYPSAGDSYTSFGVVGRMNTII